MGWRQSVLFLLFGSCAAGKTFTLAALGELLATPSAPLFESISACGSSGSAHAGPSGATRRRAT